QAIHGAACLEGGEAFQVRTPNEESSGNQIYGFLRSGREAARRGGTLEEALAGGCREVQAAFPPDPLGVPLRFDLCNRLARASCRQWRPEDSPADDSRGEMQLGQVAMWLILMGGVLYARQW
ncbi:unnamed protein product, partial [Prorocentrum cordatum]